MLDEPLNEALEKYRSAHAVDISVEPFLAQAQNSNLTVDAFGLLVKRKMQQIVSSAADEDDELFRNIENILDFTLECSDRTALSDPALPMSMIEDLMDMLTLDATSRLFDFVESRVVRITKNMDPSRGKGLVLLRFCNELLRRLSKTKNTVFCGRILVFLTSVYPLTERSGVNLRGDFNVENITLFEDDVSASDGMQIDGQQNPAVFLKPVALISRTPLEGYDNGMDNGVEKVLKEFDLINDQTTELSPMGKTLNDKKRKERNDRSEKRVQAPSLESHDDYFFPKFLTSRNLFELEFLLLQTKSSSSLTDPKPNTVVNKSLQYPYSLTEEQEAWVTTMRTRAMRTLELIPPLGRRFSNTLTTVITHEKNWIKWKGESCPPFEKTEEKFEPKKRKLEVGVDKDNTLVKDSRRQQSSAATSKTYMGHEQLTKLWANGLNVKEVLTDPNRVNEMQSLEEFLAPLADQLNPDGTMAEGVEEQYLWSKDNRYNWRSYRAAMRYHFHLFHKVETIDSAALWKKMRQN
ncbi:hypothetical protein HDU76_001540 [Blyttiomyces sp. JEL0837]|nr:hypothetical protein HDU76_001540 [Blyttiomyces sp. JEL0837]